MKLNTRSTVTVLAAAACLAGPLAAVAEPLPSMAPAGEHHGPMGAMGPGGAPGPGPGHHGGPRGGMPPLPPGLELSEAQHDKVFAIMHAQAPQHRELEKAAHKAREALHALVKGGELDDKKATALSQAVGLAEAALELQRARSAAQVLAVLTSEQRKQMDAERPHPHRHP